MTDRAGDAQDSGVAPSPCVRRCTLDAQDVCVGCFRTVDEIMRWSAMADDEKWQVLAELDTRRRRQKPGESSP